ncbi:MAG: hypothetical protein MJE77_17130 [Proteobacteria bacterium]|nr:hypothetical protein [Pseudomonadota bacterium]
MEDSALFELNNILGPIYASHRYDLTLAPDATRAAEILRHRQFDAIVVDIRLPPGRHEYWRTIFRKHHSDRTNAKLGLELLHWLLGDPTHHPLRNGANPPRRPEWPVTPQHIGVFSVESRLEIGDQLKKLGVNLMYEKQPGLPETILMDIVNEVLGQVE